MFATLSDERLSTGIAREMVRVCKPGGYLLLKDRIVLKRLFDIVTSTLGLVVFSPVLATITIWIKLDSPGPVCYRGVRVGLKGRQFRIFKFRSMVIDAERLGASSTSEDDPRITKPGRFVRRFKLDELPQLINVLVGDMSWVGPRPQVQWAVDLYTAEERALLDVRPGITDYASLVYCNEGEILKGSLDPDKDYLEKIAPGKIRLGMRYVREHSLWIDVKLMVATALAILGVNPAWCLPASERCLAVIDEPREDC